MIPVMIVLALFTFGLSCIVLHFGVFVDDLYNVMNVVLRLMFYMSGIFYSIGTKLSEPYRSILLKCNPVSMLIESAKNVVCFIVSLPYRKLIVLWGIVSCFSAGSE